MFLYVVLGIGIFISALAALLYFTLDKRTVYKTLENKHVVITGGSSGIGKHVAIEVARLGADVTVIGRDEGKLNSTVQLIKSQCKTTQNIQYVALDVTSNYDAIQQSLSELEARVAPIFMLVNCAGMCVCGQFEEMKIEDIKYMIDLNYFGTAYPTKYVLHGMKKRNEGLIVFVSSEAALIGIYGYSAYSAAKWAVRGLAESVFMELVGTNVNLTLAFPPDTDTPGFENEELTKPKETKLISGSGGLQSPEAVGKKIVYDALNGRSYSTFGMSGFLMSTLYCGTIDSISQVLLQVLSMGVLRAVVVVVTLTFHKIIKDGLKEKKETAKSK